MATFLDSINTPVVQMGLLRSAVPVLTPAFTAETVAALTLFPEIGENPELPPEPLVGKTGSPELGSPVSNVLTLAEIGGPRSGLPKSAGTGAVLAVQNLDGQQNTPTPAEMGVDTRFETFDGVDPIAAVVSLNLRRRHLNESQRAMVAAKLANLNQGRPPKNSPIGDIFEAKRHPPVSQERAASMLNEGTASDVRHGGASEVCATVAQTAAADFAQAIHVRRALEGALDHGTALLAALGLPRLMEPGFVPLDATAIGDAVDTAIATLDAMDAAGVDLEDDGTAEPSLGWIDGMPTLSDSHDDREAEDDDEPILGAPERHPSCYQFALCDATSSQEHWADGSARHDEAEAVNEDGGDILDEGEETLGWAANVGQLALGQTTADGDITALERHGRGFLRSGPEDTEDDDPAGAQQPDEDALFWSVDIGYMLGTPLDGDGAHV